MNIQIREKIFSILERKNQDPKIELEYNTPFQLLIAVLLSAQTKDKSVNLVTKKLFPDHGTPEGFLNLGEKNLENLIRSIGLYKTKARNVLKSSQLILNKHQGKVPSIRSDLEKLPGIGRKSANVLLNVLFGKPTIAVDTHVFRVSNRTGLASGMTVAEVEKKLLRNTPNQYKKRAHHWLVLLGRYTCIAKKPKCASCSIFDLCEFKNKLSI